MTPEEIKTKIREIIHRTANIDPAKIGDNARFVEDLDLDSLTRMEVAVNVDQAFALDFPEEEMDRLVDVETTAQLVLEYLDRNR